MKTLQRLPLHPEIVIDLEWIHGKIEVKKSVRFWSIDKAA